MNRNVTDSELFQDIRHTTCTIEAVSSEKAIEALRKEHEHIKYVCVNPVVRGKLYHVEIDTYTPATVEFRASVTRANGKHAARSYR